MSLNESSELTTCPAPQQEQIAGLILAGGRGMRMGRVDKAMVEIDGQLAVAGIVDALRMQVDKVLIARQKDQDDLSDYGHVVVDEKADQGPIQGVLVGADTARDLGYRFMVTVAVDARRVPSDLIARLWAARAPHAMMIIGGRMHPTFALYDLARMSECVIAFENGERRLMGWLGEENCGYAVFPIEAIDNVNEKNTC